MMELMSALSADDPAGFDVDMLASNYRRQRMAGICEFVLEPAKVEAPWKLSQNRSHEDREAVIATLLAQQDAVSAQMADKK